MWKAPNWRAVKIRIKLKYITNIIIKIVGNASWMEN